MEIYKTKIDNQTLNNSLLLLANTLESNEDKYVDDFPITVNPYAFKNEEIAKSFKESNKLDAGYDAEACFNYFKEKYEVKDVKNKGLFSENLKMEKEEDGNGVLIVLANDPSVKIEDVKPSGPSFLPQTGDFDIIIKIISTMLIINLIIGTTIFIYKKRK